MIRMMIIFRLHDAAVDWLYTLRLMRRLSNEINCNEVMPFTFNFQNGLFIVDVYITYWMHCLCGFMHFVSNEDNIPYRAVRFSSAFWLILSLFHVSLWCKMSVHKNRKYIQSARLAMNSCLLSYMKCWIRQTLVHFLRNATGGGLVSHDRSMVVQD